MKICVDTSAFAQFMRGHNECIEAIRRADFVGLPTVVIGELRVGFRRTKRKKKDELTLSRFMSRSVVRILSVDEDAARHYEDIAEALHQRDLRIPTNDIWIASIAAREGATVLTYDTYFGFIERVASEILTRPPPIQTSREIPNPRG